MSDEPWARVILPRWVRVLAFLRIPFALRRARAAKFMNWYLQKNKDRLVAELQSRVLEGMLYGGLGDRPMSPERKAKMEELKSAVMARVSPFEKKET